MPGQRVAVRRDGVADFRCVQARVLDAFNSLSSADQLVDPPPAAVLIARATSTHAPAVAGSVPSPSPLAHTQ